MTAISRHVRAALAGAALVVLPLAPIGVGAAVAQEVGPRSVADLAEGLLGSVVNISTSQRVDAERSVPMPDTPDEDTPFQEFFDEFFDQDDAVPDPRRVQSLGSGFVISADGVVVTNNHVVKDADEVVVNFADGSKLEAKILGVDPKTDLAVLKVDPPKPLKPLEFAASEDLRVGDWVMAIGNPFGLGGTVTVGIISARNRNLQSGPYDDFIQTDAAINRGNSGGPLFDMNGHVIGINTAIISPSGGSIGIGFAIPSEIAVSVITQLQQYGETRRGWMGVRIQSVSDEIAESLGMAAPKGALIAGVTAEGPAEKAGIQAGDVVTRFDGRDVNEMRDLPRIVAETTIGKTVPVTVMRDGNEVEIAVEIGQLEESEARATPVEEATPEPAPATPAPEKTSVLGMILSPLTDEQRQVFEIADDIDGVLVLEVEDDSRAAEKRVTAGDVILEVGQRQVSAPEDVLERLDKLREDGRNTAILTLSNKAGQLRFTALRLDK
ncbi:Do family serine endopeptidase [Acuticoccus mangrovi]|uniref:Probable periplasmic serine endoprotease DegP-like n=1 Tax=Acuticoccus mangrovi TaxID=2796142 RepID=A0A934MCQ5_9HYPH|nr:Do family serine endopeptidase [Acuticoccus mangrovi]MBJ3775527.1 Do family serine endopeptidase [Acuticoccus mangrovi]